MALLFGVDVVLWRGEPSAHLEVEVAAATTDSQAEVFFDTGQGFNARETATALVRRGSETRRLSFPMPPQSVRAIRYDPLTTAGAIELRTARIVLDSGREVRRLTLARTLPLNEIQALTPTADGRAVNVQTTGTANDPQLLLALDAPVRPEYTAGERWGRLGWTNVGLIAGALASLAAWLWRARWGFLLERATRPLERVAAWRGWPESVPMDRWAIGFYAACVLGFGGMAAAGLHGSSIRIYDQNFVFGDAPQASELLGTPRRVRSDEWGFHTPAILNQLFRRDTLAVRDTTLGPGPAALLSNVPCRHPLEFFRPQFWAFHFLPADVAFAVYWQAKGLLLLTGVFTLLLMLCRSGFVAVTGALWYGLSAYTQWAYSWPSLLPEMVGLSGWTIVLFCGLMTAKGGPATVVAGAAFVLAAVDFVLCFYPPHQIPLALCGIAVVAWWVSSRRREIFVRDGWAARWAVLVVATLAVAGGMGYFLWEARESLRAAAATVYPGLRSVDGGNISLTWLLSQFLDFWKSEETVPPALLNICEASGFLWLAPAALATGGFGLRRTLESRTVHPRPPDVYLWAPFAVLAVWMLLPVPAAVGQWLLLDRVPGFRCFHALGLLNIAIVTVFLARTSGRTETLVGTTPARTTRDAGVVVQADRVLIGWLSRGTVLGVALVLTNGSLENFFPSWSLVVAAAYGGWLMTCLAERWQSAFAGSLLIPLACFNLRVNPLDRGLGAVRETSLFRAVEHSPQLKEGKWLVFGPADGLAGLLRATGVDVFNSLRIIPDIDRLVAFDPTGAFRPVINQSGYLLAEPLPVGQLGGFENPVVGTQIWRVNPADPRLKPAGIRYVAFPAAPDPAFITGLRPVAASIPGMWLYELP